MKMIVMERRIIDRLNGSIDSEGLKKPHASQLPITEIVILASGTDHGTLEDLKEKVKKLTDPKPMFDCYRVNRLAT